ncbi:MAG: hypothetical protein WCW17_02535 [Patescibacteria group bacterium]
MEAEFNQSLNETLNHEASLAAKRVEIDDKAKSLEVLYGKIKNIELSLDGDNSICEFSNQIHDSIGTLPASSVAYRAGIAPSEIDLEMSDSINTQAVDLRIELLNNELEKLKLRAATTEEEIMLLNAEANVLQAELNSAYQYKAELVKEKRTSVLSSAGKLGNLEMRLNRLKSEIDEYYQGNKTTTARCEKAIELFNILSGKRKEFTNQIQEKQQDLVRVRAKDFDAITEQFINTMVEEQHAEAEANRQKLENSVGDYLNEYGVNEAGRLNFDDLRGGHKKEREELKKQQIVPRYSLFTKISFRVRNTMNANPNIKKAIGALGLALASVPALFVGGQIAKEAVDGSSISSPTSISNKVSEENLYYNPLRSSNEGTGQSVSVLPAPENKDIKIKNEVQKVNETFSKSKSDVPYTVGPKTWGDHAQPVEISKTDFEIDTSHGKFEDLSTEAANQILLNIASDNNIPIHLVKKLTNNSENYNNLKLNIIHNELVRDESIKIGQKDWSLYDGSRNTILAAIKLSIEQNLPEEGYKFRSTND